MNKNVIHTEKAPAAIGPYSQGIKVNGMLFVSGQIPINPASGTIEAKDIAGQTTQVFKNLQEIITKAGGNMGSIVKTTVYLQNMKDFAAMNEVYATFFTSDFPARVAVEVAALPKGALVEIDAICAL